LFFNKKEKAIMNQSINNTKIHKNSQPIENIQKLISSPSGRKGGVTPKSAGNAGFRKHNRMKFMKTERMKRLNRKTT